MADAIKGGHQLGRQLRAQILTGLDGAAVLIGNDYEFGMMAKAVGLTEAALTRKAARILRVHFRRQRELVLGPDLSHQRNLMPQILRAPAVVHAMQQQHHALAAPAGYEPAGHMATR